MKKLKENSDGKKEIKEARIHIRTTTTKKELLQLKAKDSERTHCLKKHPKAWLLKQIEKKLEVNPIEVAPIIVEKVNAA